MLGLQSIAQISTTYGQGEAQTIVDNCGNSLILRCSASERGGTAQYASKLIGDREIIRQTISRSRGGPLFLAGGHAHKSVNTSEQHVTQPAVMASEIEQLPDLVGLVKLTT